MGDHGTFGKVTRYNPGADWESYTEQLDFYFIANKVTDGKTKKAIVLANLSPETFQLLKDLIQPAKPKDDTVTYDAIVKTLKEHTKPEKSALVARYEFDHRYRKPGESVSEYVATLKHMAGDCKFSDEMRTERLRDRLVSGIKDDKMLRDLLKEKLSDLTFDQAVRKCLAIEQANKDVMAFKTDQESKASDLNKLDGSSKTSKQTQQGRETTGSPRKPDQKDTAVKCYRCDGNHDPKTCSFIKSKCFACGKAGHIKRACKQNKREEKPQANQPGVNVMEDDSWGEPEQEDEWLGLYEVRSKPSRKPIRVDVEIQGTEFQMELDTGSAVSVISEKKYRKQLGHVTLDPTSLKLHTYTGESLVPLGVMRAHVRYGNQDATLPLYVIPGNGPTLFGREWLHEIQLNWPLLNLTANQSLEDVLNKHASVFKEDLGTLKGIKARIQLREDAVPKFWKARPVALARKPAVERGLETLEAQGIIKQVPHSDWAAPIVTPFKKNGEVRICGDFKVTVNSQLRVDEYPLPRIDEIYANLSGGKQFSTLDLRQAYLQMELEEDSKQYLTINTTRGLFQYQRLAYGVASAPAVWQRAMDQVLQGIPRVQCYLDDIIVTGSSPEEHLATLDRVLTRLEEYGLRANRQKCKFMLDSVEYLGHTISAEGLRQSKAKVDAMTQLPVPENVGQLRSFLGMVQYYARFLPDLATHLAPLHQLLQKDVKWVWGAEQQESFSKVKGMLSEKRVLTHFNPDLPLVLACDSSSYGLGAVLSHVMPDGNERPIAYASRSLTKTEAKYAQIEKEALGLYWGVRKFQTYLEGRHFKMITDHKPLKYIMDPGKAVPVTTAARLQRWCLFLGAFSYEIEFRGTKEHANCDGLSRLPLSHTPEDKADEVELFHMTVVDALPVTEKELQRETNRDPLLAQVGRLVESGWEGVKSHPDIAPYSCRKDQLTVHHGILMWGSRVVVPPKLREKVLGILHEGHIGMVKMKGVARGYVWWPQIDSEIEDTAKRCQGCQEVARNPARAPLHRWEYPARPWQRLHIDFAGPVSGKMVMVVTDAHTKWPEIFIMRENTTAPETVATLRTLFARMGLPEQIVSDNGPQFTSGEFERFNKLNGIRHVTGAAYHPATNGLAERIVQSFKSGVKADLTHRSLQHKLDRYLFAYRNAPHATTGYSPAQLLFGRKLRSRLDLLIPDVKRQVDKKLLQNESRPLTSFEEGSDVWVRNYRGGPKWMRGKVLERDGPVMYRVQVNDYTWRRHVEQLRAALTGETYGDAQEVQGPVVSDPQLGQPLVTDPLLGRPAVDCNPATGTTTASTLVETPASVPEIPSGSVPDSPVLRSPQPRTTRSGRVVRPPERFV